MKEKLSIVVFVLFAIQLAKSKELVTRSQIIFTKDNENWSYNKLENKLERQHIRYKSLTELSVHHQSVDMNTTGHTHVHTCTYTIVIKDYSYEEQLITIDKKRKFFILKYTTSVSLLSRFPRWDIYILDIPSCKVSDHKLSLPLKGQVQFERDSHAIIFKNYTLCGDSYCKMTVDSELNVLDGPEPWIELPGELSSVQTVESKNRTDVVLLLTVGSAKYLTSNRGLKKIVVERERNCSRMRALSKVYDAIGIVCDDPKRMGENSIDNITLYVEQYDLDGNCKLQVNLTYSGMTEVVAMKNLENGGFVLVASEYDGLEYTLYATKYSTRGHAVSQPLKIDGFTDPRYLSIQPIELHERIRGLNCLSQIRRNWPKLCGSQECVGFLEKCFTDQDLKPL